MERSTVEAKADGTTDYVPLSGGFAIPRRFTSTARSGDRTVAVTVEVVDGQAFARSLCVESQEPAGVTSTTMREVNIRILMANGARELLCRVDLTGRSPKLVPVKDGDREALLAIRELVGYLGLVWSGNEGASR